MKKKTNWNGTGNEPEPEPELEPKTNQPPKKKFVFRKLVGPKF